MRWWSWLVLGALAGAVAGWLLWRRPPPEVLTPAVSPELEAITARADALAGLSSSLADSLAAVRARLAAAGARPRPPASLPPVPVDRDSLVAWAQEAGRLYRAAVADNDSLRVAIALGVLSLQQAADTARALAGRLRVLAGDLANATDRVRTIEGERDRFAGEVARLRRSPRFGVGADAMLAGEGWTALAGLTAEVHRAVLFSQVSASVLAGYGIGGKVGEVPQPGPGAALRVALTF